MEESANPNQTSISDSPFPRAVIAESTMQDDNPEGELVPELLEPAPIPASRVSSTEGFTEGVFGDDQRKPIHDTTTSPFNRICQLEITTARGGSMVGTGWVLATRMVITAGHCVWRHEEGDWVRKISVHFGRNGGRSIESMNITRTSTANPFDTPLAFTQSDSRQKSAAQFDYGAILLPKAIGPGVKRMGVSSSFDATRLRSGIFNIFGYPADMGATVLFGCGARLSSVSERLLEYDIDTAKGQSGSPVFQFKKDAEGRPKYTVVGIHNSEAQGSSVNFAARIEARVGTKLEQWRRRGER